MNVRPARVVNAGLREYAYTVLPDNFAKKKYTGIVLYVVFHGHGGSRGIPSLGTQPDRHLRQGSYKFLDTGRRRYPVQTERHIRDHPGPSEVRDVYGVHAERGRLVWRFERVRRHLGTW